MEYIPEEIHCAIVNLINNFPDLHNYILTCKLFMELARRYLKYLNSNFTVKISLTHFSSLQELGDRIILKTECISTLPKLRKANLTFSVALGNLNLLEDLDISGDSGDLDLLRDLDILGDFRVSLGEKKGFYLQAGRLLTIPSDPGIHEKYPQAHIVTENLKMLDTSLRKFFMEANFPEVAKSGLITMDNFIRILRIYARRNKLYVRRMIKPDSLIRKCLGLEEGLMSLPSLVNAGKKFLREPHFDFDLSIPDLVLDEPD